MNHPWAIPVAFTLLVACRTETEQPARIETPPRARSATELSPVAPQQALDELDGRVPVPLLPVMALHQKQSMREHLEAVQEIVAGLGANDFASVELAARRIGYSEQMGRMCEHMGAGASGFTERALAFHHTADGIGDAARRRDPSAVMHALAATLATCTSCHAAYKQQVVSELLK